MVKKYGTIVGKEKIEKKEKIVLKMFFCENMFFDMFFHMRTAAKRGEEVRV